MFFAMYDRFLKTIGDTYILESWSRIQRAVDFDEMKIVGEQIQSSANPFFVVANDKQGKMMFSGLASTPSIDEKTKKTTMYLKDYMTLLNTEILVDWGSFKGDTVAEYLDFILSTWLDQTDVGFNGITWDVSNLSKTVLDPEIPIGEGVENVSVYPLVLDVLNYYNVYCDPKLNIFKKKLIFNFCKGSMHIMSIRLKDFGVTNIEKSFGEHNRATVYTYSKEKDQEWGITADNRIIKIYPSEVDNSVSLVYPAKNRNFISAENNSDALYNAIYDAVMSLARNRYQENIDLNAQQYKSILDLTKVDFSYKIAVYTEEGYYKDLPVGEIETNSKGTHIVRLGQRIQELTQEL